MLLYILLNNIAPIFALVAVGYYVGKKFNLDIYTLSKVNFYVFIPAMIFVKIYEADIDLDLIRAVLFTLGFAVIQRLYFAGSDIYCPAGTIPLACNLLLLP